MMFAACFLALATGLISLSMEVLWVRLVSYSFHSAPQSFTFVIMFYLIGIALGAVIGKRFCRPGINLWVVSGVALMLASMCNLLGPWAYAHLVFANQEFPNHWWMIGGTIILVTSLLTSIVFPIAHHLGTPHTTTRVGHAISRVYVSNIFGATLGPILTGFILLAYVTTQQAFIMLAILTLCVAIYCFWGLLNKYIVSVCSVMLATQIALLAVLNGHSLMARVSTLGYGDIMRMVENQYGIVTSYSGPFAKFPKNRVIVGNNAYDGSTNLDPVFNYNGISRVIIMSALVDQPKRVLLIGLSIGTWLKLVTSFPGVEAIDVVEINPGYLELIKDFPVHHLALSDPRVHLYIDDGRRWLKGHPDNKYDMVVMNTTYHWRAYTTNLLSQNFLNLVKQHMNAGAVLAYNSTYSLDALYTAASVFKHAYLYRSYIIAADFDWRSKMQTTAAADKLAALQLDGKPLFPANANAYITKYLHEPILSIEAAKKRKQINRELEIITDNNMITEFKYGKSI